MNIALIETWTLCHASVQKLPKIPPDKTWMTKYGGNRETLNSCSRINYMHVNGQISTSTFFLSHCRHNNDERLIANAFICSCCCIYAPNIYEILIEFFENMQSFIILLKTVAQSATSSQTVLNSINFA